MDEHKFACISGASRGIGEGIARIFAKDGYDLALICEKSTDRLNKLAESLRKEHDTKVLVYSGDISSETFVSYVSEDILSHFKSLDVLINNAGIWKGGLVTDFSLEVWNRMVAVNLTSVFLMCKALIPSMVSAKSGNIINISSIWGNNGASCESVYSATKGGINSFTQALAKELAPSGIRVNAIAPGVIDTDMNAGYTKEEKEELKNMIPMGRFGRPEEIGMSALSIINSPYMTGQIITVGGGFE